MNGIEHLVINELVALTEGMDVECKAAQGSNGRGELPNDFWKTYSAMANSDGGVIWLGIEERPPGHFRVVGIAEIERVRKALWDNLHNRKQISVNLLAEQDVQPVWVDEKMVLRVKVPRALRQDKPVHLSANPLGHTYLRRHEGDYVADDETVRRMMAERVEDSRDERILKGFDLTDLDAETMAAYRNRFTAVKPGHIWSDLSLPDFLERIGVFGRNREDATSGLRIAGLLMFGRAEVIRDALPNYMVDYQEQSEAGTDKRWIDRLIPDGSWSGNVYDFFRRVYQKLTTDLKVPFQLQGGQRIDDSPVHEALREALVNTLIHADFTGRTSVLVVKRPDMFSFRNPGSMRLPLELAVIGGNSDCRNRRMQTMFQLVGYGDHAGSGVPKIYRNWAGQHWRHPVVRQQAEPEQTSMELSTTSLLPPEAVTALKARWGDRFTGLGELERLALVTVFTEGALNHTRLRELSTHHPTDITKMLARLVKDGILVSEGVGRGTVYRLPGNARSQDSLFALDDESVGLSLEPPPLTQELSSLTQELPPSTQELGGLRNPRAEEDEASSVKVISQMTQLREEDLLRLQLLAQPVSSRRRATPELVKQTVLKLCEGHYLGLRLLAELLVRRDRNGADLRQRILNPLVAQGLLVRAHPQPNDPRQAYRSALETAPPTEWRHER